MLGPPKRRALDQPVLVSLERLVPADHFYRHLDAALDLSFVREWVADRYRERGRPSIDPVVFFKLQLILFFDATKIRANAALGSVVPRFDLQAQEQAHEHLAALFAEEPAQPPDAAG